ncbi:hypothetical protein [Aestuariibacter salexigens]|uniref:hypothetical protein n=1 Tax=Aestuariibacter salexigens TaxID=226010 RepID=UPI00040DE2B2|nr:hypothetical protein [Aestuariibacter salexigens]
MKINREQKLIAYTLKLDEGLWRDIEKARTKGVGLLHADGISKKKFIETAIREYIAYLNSEVFPKVEKLNNEIEPPTPFFYQSGVDINW